MAGIIPARAGFTSSRGAARCASRDHPRSRGVYVGAARVLGELDGIIPARAGFTSTTRRARSASRDHPRSRGVYYAGNLPGTVHLGSSPLARGLLWQYRCHGGGRGIIPARAGFTRPGTLPRRDCGDHPRSRGVYMGPRHPVGGGAGSSPLARGLQWVAGPFLCPARIIPARAGFTGRPHRRAPLPRDHPRSRGVYGSNRCA